MEKRLDGIKKISGRELAYSRKVVLESIGEPEVKEKEIIFKAQTGGKSLDGLYSVKQKRAELPREKTFQEPEDLAENKRKIKEEEKESKVRALIKQKEEERKIEKEKIKEARIAAREEEKRLAKQKKEEEKKRKEAEKLSAKEKAEEEKKIKEENEKIKKEEELKIKEKEKKDKKLKRERARRKRKKNYKKFKEKIINFFFKAKREVGFIFSLDGLKKISGFLAWTAIWLFAIASVLYLFFSLLVLRFNFAEKINKEFAWGITVPAVITKAGFIDYSAFIEIKKDLEATCGEDELVIKIKEESLKKIIKNKLTERYNIQTAGKSQNELDKELNKNLILDREFNRVAFLRINDILNLSGKENFSFLIEKKIDSIEKISPEELDKIKISEAGGIIVSDKGYYLQKGEEYIFIKAVNLDDYIKSASENMKTIILAN